jgi:glycogen debranching enzyme
LKANILKNFYDPQQNKLYYLVDNRGVVDKSQEALGLSFAVIFNVIDENAAQKIIANAKTSKYGITSIYPDFPRYSMKTPGRHNNIIWPMVTGFFAQAAIKTGNKQLFEGQLNSLTHMALDPDKGNFNFREVYNPYTGKPDGGWQANNTPGEFHWASLNNQTWSATAYINMVLNGILGLKVENTYLMLNPYLPNFMHNLKIEGLKYHAATISVHVIGKGSTVSYYKINGKKVKNILISENSTGVQDIIVYLKN